MSQKNNSGCSLILLIIFFIALIYIGNTEGTPKNLPHAPVQPPVQIGHKYLFCYEWDPEDPFEVPVIDTVIVLNIKKNYVQYRHLMFKHSNSTKLSTFVTCIKPLK